MRLTRLLVVLAATVAVLTVAPAAWATTHIPTTTYNSNTTWSAAGSPYVLDGDVTVASGVTLTVDPGVIVKFNGTFRRLLVNGTLSSVGTPASPIYFTSLQDDSVGGDTGGDGPTSGAPGQWLDMEFKNSTSNDVEYTTIRYGGFGSTIDYGAVKIWSGSAYFGHDTITSNQKSGIVLAGNTVTPSYPGAVVDESDVSNNGYGIYVNTSTLTLSGNSTVDNNSGVGVKFNLPSGSAPAVSSMAYSSVRSNGDWGVYIGVGSTFSSSLYPHGEHNNIAGNAGFVSSTVRNAGQLYEPWVQESDDWQYNYFYTGATNANCSLDPNPAQNFVATSVPDPGVVSATLYTGTGNPPPHCYANNVDTRNTLSSPAW